MQIEDQWSQNGGHLGAMKSNLIQWFSGDMSIVDEEFLFQTSSEN